MTIRHATEADLDAMMDMIAHSRGLMRADGNTVQWTDYPTVDDLREDIRRGVSYIGLTPLPISSEERGADTISGISHPSLPRRGGGGEAFTFALVPGVEPTYGYIDHGRWIDNVTPYATVHRLAKSTGVVDVSREVFAFAKRQCAYLRADTHADNRPMRHILAREGFVESGIVYMDDGSPRVAYEWWRWDEVPADLKAFVEQEIIPQYRHFDAAHNEQHVRRVIARAMMLTNHQSQLTTFTAAAMHDLGIAFGRERHHLESGRIIRACRELRQWFSEAEVEEIAQAAEDHRASANEPPRSLLGCIVAEADRDVEPETIVRRTVEFGLSHYPELDREGHWHRTLEHLHEKYAEGGYIKLWLPESPNAAPLAELRTLIADESRLRLLFDKYFKP